MNRWRKRGIATIAIQYPVGYFGTLPTYVAIYHSDGTVVVTHGGIECGQGINTKVAQVVAHTLGIAYEMVCVKASNNVIAANGSMTAASITSEAICHVRKKTAIPLCLDSIHYSNCRQQKSHAKPSSPVWHPFEALCHRIQHGQR